MLITVTNFLYLGKGATMSKFFDSPEVEYMRKYIDNKEAYLKTLAANNNKAAYQKVQGDTMQLKNNILPILLNNTSVIHSEFGKYAVRGFETALQYKCNGLIIYQPIDENYTDSPIVGILNNRQLNRFGTFGAIELDIINMDGNGAKIRPINLPLNLLL